MTDMQLIVPPLEEQSEPGGVQDEGRSQSGRGVDKSNDVLSPELREHFEAMKTLWRQSRRSDDGEEGNEALRHKAREKAIETALAVESETNRLQREIAELETLLRQQEVEQDGGNLRDEDDSSIGESELDQQQRDVVGRNVIVFPFLPPVIPAEGDDDSNFHSDDSYHQPATTTSPSDN